ncbi:Ig-like domain-containing protein [Pontibacillus yanchengensis]|nr:Ig-like domain-containing protein [Pontibacillus yanchengensis]
MHKKIWSSIMLTLAIMLVSSISVSAAKEMEAEENVSLGKKWTITFNTEVDDAAANRKYIAVMNEDGEAVQNVVTFDGKKAYVYAPADNYDPDTSYTLNVDSDLQFTNGKTLKEDVTMDFTTADTAKEDSYLDSEFAQLLTEGKMKGMPLQTGVTKQEVKDEIGTDFETADVEGADIMSYPDKGYGYGYSIKSDYIHVLANYVSDMDLHREDLIQVLGEPTSEGVNTIGSDNYIMIYENIGDNYKLLVDFETKEKSSKLVDISLVELGH